MRRCWNHPCLPKQGSAALTSCHLIIERCVHVVCPVGVCVYHGQARVYRGAVVATAGALPSSPLLGPCTHPQLL